MGNFIINVIGVFLLMILGMYLYFKLNPRAFDRMLEKQLQKNAVQLKKDEKDLHGERFPIRRDDGTVINTNLYIPRTSAEKIPVVFFAHGGSLMDGSADMIDTFCDRVKDEWEAIIVSIDYKLITEQKFPYQQNEIKDAVMWFAKNAADFKADTSKFVLAGFSGGAYLMTGAGALLKGFGFNPAGLISCYPLVDDASVRLADAGVHVSPVGIIQCGNEQLTQRISVYVEHLQNAGADVVVQSYSDAAAGFIEVNNPEYTQNPGLSRNPGISEEQENMARAAEIWMGGQLERFFNHEN